MITQTHLVFASKPARPCVKMSTVVRRLKPLRATPQNTPKWRGSLVHFLFSFRTKFFGTQLHIKFLYNNHPYHIDCGLHRISTQPVKGVPLHTYFDPPHSDQPSSQQHVLQHHSLICPTSQRRTQSFKNNM